MSGLTVVAMGRNSLIDPHLPPTVENQLPSRPRPSFQWLSLWYVAEK